MDRRKFLESAFAVCAVGSQVPALRAAGAPSPVGTGLKIPRRMLGKTGVEVSALALGGVIGMMLPPTADHDPTALAEMALDLGITYFDTAPSYNSGQSETNYGGVLARRRNEVFLATKLEKRTYDGAMQGIEDSLKRLRTDHLDLIQIHSVAFNEDLDAWEKPTGVLTAMRKLRDEKVTRFIGVTGHDSAPPLRAAIERYEFDTLLTALNPASHRIPFRNRLLPVANEKKMGVIAMKVMGGGNGCLVAGNPKNKMLATYHDQTDHQMDPAVLIRYALNLPVSVAVIGVASAEQLKANIQHACEATPMTAAEKQDLETLMG
jgi:aryl-alcohol dehydrogenase-like predicted oxidoreductase